MRTYNYSLDDLFINITTKEINTFYNLTTIETDDNLTEEQNERDQEMAFDVFDNFLDNGIFIQVWKMHDENGNLLNRVQSEDGQEFDYN